MAMLLSRSAIKPQRLRAAGPQGRGSLSSMLRLSQAGSASLPSTSALTLWARRAAALPETAPSPVA
jgi:hypothetical protein